MLKCNVIHKTGGKMSALSLTANDVLIQFLKGKRDYIKKHTTTNLLYVTKRDIKEVETWDVKVCKKIITKLNCISLSSSCPWCIKHNNMCGHCGYGLRNGKCNHSDSRFNMAIKNKSHQLLVNQNTWLQGLINKAQDSIKVL